MDPKLREMLALALLQMRDYAIIVMDPSGTIVGWFGGAEDIFGYSAQEIVGQDGALLFVEEDREKKLPDYELEVARQRAASQDDRWHLRKDGTRIWAAGMVTAVVDTNGELRGFVKLLRDRTDQRIASEERANRLVVAEAALERTNEFLRRLGHELRNPLAPIKNSAFILPRISAEPRVAQIAETIANQAAILERLAADLMDVSRLEQHRVEMRLEPVEVGALLREEAVAHSFGAYGKGVRLEAILPQSPMVVSADAARLRQAVANLLANAIKYTPAGGTVWLKAMEESGDIAIRVQDTGIGIAPDMLPRIFELFTQEPRAREVAPGGLGIGLAIVREIAMLHGGVVQARSGGVGKGSEFTLRLPRRAGNVSENG
jgi:PAS domain S-box-containing protein